MDYTNYYYSEICGYYPSDEEYNQTKKVFDYLQDCKIDNRKIIDFILNCEQLSVLTFDMLPETFWEDSLLEKNKFYYHNILHIKSKPPKWNPRTNKVETNKFFLEMIIEFNINDIIDYFYSKIPVDRELSDIKADTGAIKFLLNKYGNLKSVKIEAVDFVLSLIDYAYDNNVKINSIIELSQVENEVHEILKVKTEEANFKKSNRIIWR